MIDYLKFIEDLKEIREHKHCSQMVSAINFKINYYTKIIEENEKEYAPTEIQKIIRKEDPKFFE